MPARVEQLALSGDVITWAYLQLFPERVFGVMANQVLLAVPSASPERRKEILDSLVGLLNDRIDAWRRRDGASGLEGQSFSSERCRRDS